jgi:hypothetical protein
MTTLPISDAPSPITYYVDESGDGVLFGSKGRLRIEDPDASRFFILGMVEITYESDVTAALTSLRTNLTANPLYSSIESLHPSKNKTARFFHAKDDHAEIRAKVFELLMSLDFKFYAVIKDMRSVLTYVNSRNQMNADYRYDPNELYDFTARMLFSKKLHRSSHSRVIFARRGQSDRTKALHTQLKEIQESDWRRYDRKAAPELDVVPAYPWDMPGLQIADYCLWALQRCYERGEGRFLNAIWPKVSLIHDADDPNGRKYGTYLTRKVSPPNPEKIKSRRI